MARYIDADKLIAHLKDEIEGCKQPFGSRANGKSIAYGTELGLKSAISFAKTLSTADVVPKSEVEARLKRDGKLIYDLSTQIVDLKEAKAEVVKEIFEESEKHLVFYPRCREYSIDELDYEKIRNKYTESEGKE